MRAERVLRLRLTSGERTDTVDIAITQTVIAGWTGRDRDVMEHHIAELERIGVARPPRTPMFYRVACQCLTTAEVIEVSGVESSGEVEFVLLACHGEIWIGVGSDHTDRLVETYDITVSKQMCAKPIAGEFWRWSDVRPHWDELTLRSFIGGAGDRSLYQEGKVGAMLAPADLISRYTGGGATLVSGTLMFGGTLPALGGVRPASSFEFELVDPVLGRRLHHRYQALPLPAFE